MCSHSVADIQGCTHVLLGGDPKPGSGTGARDDEPETHFGPLLLTPGAAKQPATKDLERQRTNFFQSLRRTSTKTLDSDKPAPPSSPSTPPAHTGPPPNPPLDPPTHIPQTSASSNGVFNGQQQSGHAAEMTNGRDQDRRHSWDASDPRSKVSAEEEAFLRSLGWTEAGDDEDGESCSLSCCTMHASLSTQHCLPKLLIT